MNDYYLKRSDLKLSREAFERACLESRNHCKLVAQLLEKHGDCGPQISVVGRSHFPAEDKDRLRAMAGLVSQYSNEAYEHRPKFVRHSTIQRLGRAVAARDGCGFYGPQA